MNSGTADNQTSAILSTLSEWGITNYVKAMCFDTTAVNTGIHNGTCKAIEKTLGRELIWLPCRHHIFEIILRSAFEVYWPVSSGPNSTAMPFQVNNNPRRLRDRAGQGSPWD
ncbi:uncharacterized protein LOC141537025 [Cotesia typhae]|uniref:uncharacterized protein LOC141537025 n=1 Tax=Cotesia typhae TaxID=2053667 RepID=UPI003D68D584